jgi:hypothetical protein
MARTRTFLPRQRSDQHRLTDSQKSQLDQSSVCTSRNASSVTASSTYVPPMKAYELLNLLMVRSEDSSPEVCRGNQLEVLDSWSEKWCVLGAIQRAYPPEQWEHAMDRVLRALNVSEQGLALARMSKYDKACTLMEWSDDCRSSFLEVRDILVLRTFAECTSR